MFGAQKSAPESHFYQTLTMMNNSTQGWQQSFGWHAGLFFWNELMQCHWKLIILIYTISLHSEIATYKFFVCTVASLLFYCWSLILSKFLTKSTTDASL